MYKLGDAIKSRMDSLWIAIREREKSDAYYLAKAGLDEIAQHIEATITGGPCWVCGRQYRKIVIESGKEYYTPDCLCRPKCPRMNCKKDNTERWLQRRNGWDRCECGYFFGDDPSNWRCTPEEAEAKIYKRKMENEKKTQKEGNDGYER